MAHHLEGIFRRRFHSDTHSFALEGVHSAEEAGKRLEELASTR